MEGTRITLGKIVKPFGIKGELKLLPADDFWEGVLESKQLMISREERGRESARPVRIERSRAHGKNYVIKLDGVDDRNGAEEEVGGDLVVDRDGLDVKLPDWDLPFQVVGNIVKTEDGMEVGEVTSVMFSAAHDVYEVTGPDGVVLIPAVPEFVVMRDDDKGEITIRTIPGLIDG